MPLELLKAPPKLDKTKKSREPETLPPSLLRDIFESLVDTGMGAIGVGPDTKANRLGGLAAAALPFIPGLSKMSLGDRLKSGAVHKYPNAGRYADDVKVIPPPVNNVVNTKGRFDNVSLKGSDFPAQNRLAMGIDPASGMYDDAGRYLGSAPKVDPAFEAHLASSRGKHKLNNPYKVDSGDRYERALAKLGGKGK